MKEASLILFLFDLDTEEPGEIAAEIEALKNQEVPFIAIGNKADKVGAKKILDFEKLPHTISITATHPEDLQRLEERILEEVNIETFTTGDTVVTNIRHQQELLNTQNDLSRVLEGVDKGISNDLLAMDIRQGLHHLGEITGTITTDDLLDNIFSKFCIGK